MSFQRILLQWYCQNKRLLPWRNEKDAYKIWLSEVILQQTRVVQGLPYYLKFVEEFPDVLSLAAASEDKVLKMWQGLGYYSRARNMHTTAKIVAQLHNGIFPSDYETLLKLKGIGKYTAAAIASFAQNQAVPVVDGNVYRVLARYFGIDELIDSVSGQKTFYALASELLDQQQPGEYNQAIMEFGALYCTPKNPDCPTCIFSSSCRAFELDKVTLLPVKAKKAVVKTRYFNYLFFDKDLTSFMQKRGAGDIWENLYELPLIETEIKISSKEELKKLEDFKALTRGCNIKYIRKAFHTVHKLSHRNIDATFWHIGMPENFLIKKSAIFETKKTDLSTYGVSRLTDRFLKEYLKL